MPRHTHFAAAFCACTALVAALAAPAHAASTGVFEWSGTSWSAFANTSRGGGAAKSGVADATARDGRALRLSIPAGAGASPSHAAEVATKNEVDRATITARMRTADCSGQPETGAVSSLFTYGNDGLDHDGDGIVDNNEIDIEVLCARPSELHLSIWTDYDADGDQQRVTRTVDLATGTVGPTCYLTDWDSCASVSDAESRPTSVAAIAGFDSSKAYHTYRITWRPKQVVFRLVDGAEETVLWDYRGPTSRIPQQPSAVMFNLWHTDDWAPDSVPEATRTPSAKLSAFVDWVKIAS